ncbi:hypothetical protein EHQ58_15330 [Leptospira ognonensis]|uniref:Rod shape-determining protein MreD n=1 Tax=Leptospira ognonensis TaxID=2484945 RepID=A0A4V3JQT3_9LEPT|nr:DUF6580 family putative transport protein [Leptospira ognonensis]TGL57156.1 hypothetical protein EHQ58_15330 [Leptospira ognonensis]
MFQSRFLTAILMVLVAAFSRILPHPPNFSPILAVSLFSGAYLVDKRLAYLVPLAAMFVSDLFLGFHALMPVIYLLMVLFVFLGTRLSKSVSATKTLGFTLVSSVLFFFATNLAVWLTSGMYSIDLTGFVSCFTLALPFFQNSLLGDLVYSGILFGAMMFLERTVFKSSIALSRV